MSFSAECPRRPIEPFVGSLLFDNFLENVCTRATWDIFIENDKGVRPSYRVADEVIAIKWQKGLNVDQFDINANTFEQCAGFLSDSHTSTIGDERQVFALAQYFRHAQRHSERSEIGGDGFLHAITVQHFDHEGRLAGCKQRVVHARRLRTVARCG